MSRNSISAYAKTLLARLSTPVHCDDDACSFPASFSTHTSCVFSLFSLVLLFFISFSYMIRRVGYKYLCVLLL